MTQQVQEIQRRATFWPVDHPQPQLGMGRRKGLDQIQGGIARAIVTDQNRHRGMALRSITLQLCLQTAGAIIGRQKNRNTI